METEQTPGETSSTPDMRSWAAPFIERAPLPLIEVQGGAHVVSYVNAAFCRLLGKTREELLGSPFADIVPGGDECVPVLDRVYHTGEAVTHARANDTEPDSGHWLYAMWPALDPADRPVGVIIQVAKASQFREKVTAISEALLIAGLHQHELTEEAELLNEQLLTEIAERKKTEAALAKSESLFRSLYEALPVAAFVCNCDAVIQNYNQLATELWGRAPERGVERHCGSVKLILMDGTELPLEQSPMVEVLRTGRPALNVEVFIERPDGSRLPVLVNYAALKDAHGEVTGAVTCFLDLSDRRRAEEALRLAMVETERASRAKDDFFAALSHELRTPLTPVLMTAAALENDPGLSPDVRDQLGMMRRNIELEARLIDDLLDLTAISHGKMHIESVVADVHQLLEHTADIVRSDGLGKQVRIRFALEAPRHHAMADPTRLQQVFWNLIKNALKFTPSGGSITVTTRNDDAGSLLVSVVDTGIGIAPDSLQRIFNAFEQVEAPGHHRFGGLGLGLAISKSIIDAHGGGIEARSDGPGLGATFRVTLATVDAAEVIDAGRSLSPVADRALRLLIVEDHAETLAVMARLLTRSGHMVTTASTSRQALAAFGADAFDAVITDLGLPDGSGLDLMREIQRLRPVPGIALSGYGMKEDLLQTKAAGFFAHLVKPVNLNQLRLLLDQLGER